jgi:hypothetical protein
MTPPPWRKATVRSLAGAAVAVAVAVPLLAMDASSNSTAEAPRARAPAAPVSELAATPAVPANDPFAAPSTDAAPTPQRGLAQAAVDAAQAEASGSTQLAVAVLDRETGELALGGRGNEPYYTASLSKLVVIVDVLDRRRLHGLAVSDGDRALFQRALGPSDDSAMSALWDHFDGAGAVGRVRERLSLQGTSAPRRAGQWGEVEVTAADYVRVWAHILDDMPPEDRDLLISDMEAAPPVAHDGFDQSFGLLSPAVRGPGGPGAVAKQGWMCCFSGQYYLHSAGAVGADRRFLVALLTREPRGRGWAAARTELTGIARQTVEALE